MDYGEIITKSAKLIWKHKILWFFGLLAGLGGGNTNPSFNFNVANLNPGNLNIPQPLQRFFTGMAEMIRQTPGWFFLMLIFLVCGLGLVFFMINVFGRTGLTRGAWQADDGSESLEFGKLVSEIWPAFWRVAGQTLLIGLPGFAISLIFFMFLLFGFITSVSREAPGIILVLLCVGLPMICLMVPFFWFLGIWSQLSTVAVVGEGRGIIDGLKRGWELIRRNLGPVVVVGLLVLLAQIGLGILTGLILAPIGIGALLGSLVFKSGGTFSLEFFLPFLLVAIPLSLILTMFFQSYTGTLWTLVFRRLAAAEGAQPPVTAPPPVYPTVPPPGNTPGL